MQTDKNDTSPVKIFLTNPLLDMPKYATAGSAGFDLQASIEAPVTVEPGEMKPIATGLRVALEVGTELQIRPRSGHALKHSLTIMNAPGTIDSDYRGEIFILLTNLGKAPYTVKPGERIAQAVLARYLRANFDTNWNEAELKTDRGSGGFGSTGTAG